VEYVFKKLPTIKAQLQKSRFVLLLDFDLTLSPLVKNPAKAILPKDTKIILKGLLRHILIAVISGRKLEGIKRRVNIPGIIYAGNHGLEYEMNGVIKNTPISNTSHAGLKVVKGKFLKLKRKYNGIFIEDKKTILALHYRSVTSKDKPLLLKNLKEINVLLGKYRLLGVLYKKTFEVRPTSKKDKGTISLFIIKKMHDPKNLIYIGDGRTDEDAFVALERNGITIRVGKNNKSKAKWYLRNQKEVNKFLRWLLNLLNHRDKSFR